MKLGQFETQGALKFGAFFELLTLKLKAAGKFLAKYVLVSCTNANSIPAK